MMDIRIPQLEISDEEKKACAAKIDMMLALLDHDSTIHCTVQFAVANAEGSTFHQWLSNNLLNKMLADYLKANAEIILRDYGTEILREFKKDESAKTKLKKLLFSVKKPWREM